MNTAVERMEPKILTLHRPIMSICKYFVGDYVRSQHYVQEVQRQLIAHEMQFLNMAVIGVYYDDPRTVPAAQQRSLQGVLVEKLPAKLPEGFEALVLEGRFLHIRTTDPQKLGLAYHELIEYALANNLKFASPEGKQIATFSDNNFAIDIYFELLPEEA